MRGDLQKHKASPPKSATYTAAELKYSTECGLAQYVAAAGSTRPALPAHYVGPAVRD